MGKNHPWWTARHAVGTTSTLADLILYKSDKRRLRARNNMLPPGRKPDSHLIKRRPRFSRLFENPVDAVIAESLVVELKRTPLIAFEDLRSKILKQMEGFPSGVHTGGQFAGPGTVLRVYNALVREGVIKTKKSKKVPKKKR